MKSALIQLSPEFGKVSDNLQHALGLMRTVKSQLYVLPELFNTGYTFGDRSELLRTAEDAQRGPTYEAMLEFARQRNAYVVYGFAEREGAHFYNAANTVGPQGLIGTYRKMHLFGREKLFFTPGGNPAPVYNLPIGRIGVMICFDWYFPETARSLALRGAQLIAHPANLVLPHCPNAMMVRSLENRVFSLTCDRVGIERNGDVMHRFIGTSQAIGPRGEILVRMDPELPEARVLDLNLELADNKQLGPFNDLFEDRRPELYDEFPLKHMVAV